MATKAIVSDTTAYAAIVKFEEQEDGTVLAYGKATDATLDADEQICDPDWLKRAMPEWFKYGNIREQHSSIAAGVATEYEETEDGHYITAHIVDPSSAKKIKTGVLKGFSIGIRRPRVIKDNKAAGGRIVDGQIVEISVVDRPANPSCVLTVAKASKGELKAVKSVFTELTKGSPDQPRDERGRFGSSDGGDSGGDTGSTVADSVQEEVQRGKDQIDAILMDSTNAIMGFLEDPSTSAKESGVLRNANSAALSARDLMYDGDYSQAANRLSDAADKLTPITLNSNYENNEDYGALQQYMRDASEGMFALALLSDGGQASDSATGERVGGFPKSVDTEISKGSPDQPRDENGRFASGGGDSGGDSGGSATGGISPTEVINMADAVASQVDDCRLAMGDLGYDNFDIDATCDELDSFAASAQKLYENGFTESAAQYAEKVGSYAAEAHSNYDEVGFLQLSQDAIALSEAMRENPTDDMGKYLKSISTKENIMKADAILEMSKEWAGSDTVKFDQAAFDNARRALATLIQVEAGEMAEGHDETYSLNALLRAVGALMEWQEGEAYEGETKLMPEPMEEMEMAIEPESVKEDLTMCKECGKAESDCTCKMCKECGKAMGECKCSGMKSAEPEVAEKCLECGCHEPANDHGRDDVTTAVVVSDKSQVSDIQTMVEDIVKELLTNPSVGEEITTKAADSERIEALESELAQVKSLAAPSGPKRFAAVSNKTPVDVNKAKAAIFRAKAANTLDKSLANGYLALAIDLEKIQP
jgi:hypothetical protein